MTRQQLREEIRDFEQDLWETQNGIYPTDSPLAGVVIGNIITSLKQELLLLDALEIIEKP